jgi:hypothetical protein
MKVKISQHWMCVHLFELERELFACAGHVFLATSDCSLAVMSFPLRQALCPLCVPEYQVLFIDGRCGHINIPMKYIRINLSVIVRRML